MSRRPPDQSPSYHSGSPKVPLPQVRVVLRHTADQPLMTVVRIIMELTRFGREEATHRMWEVLPPRAIDIAHDARRAC